MPAMMVKALGRCHAECPWCARDYWRWLSARMRNPLAAAAAESVRPR